MILVTSTVRFEGVGVRVEGLGLRDFRIWGFGLLVFCGPPASMTVYPTFHRTYTPSLKGAKPVADLVSLG